jgi:hypothetical protein
LSSVYILVQEFWFEIPPSSYITPYKDSASGNCLLGFGVNQQDSWIMGDTFLINYYAIFDDENSFLTLAPKIGGSFKSINMGDTPTRTFTAWDNTAVNAPIFTLMGLIMAGGGVFTILAKYGYI